MIEFIIKYWKIIIVVLVLLSTNAFSYCSGINYEKGVEAKQALTLQKKTAVAQASVDASSSKAAIQYVDRVHVIYKELPNYEKAVQILPDTSRASDAYVSLYNDAITGNPLPASGLANTASSPLTYRDILSTTVNNDAECRGYIEQINGILDAYDSYVKEDTALSGKHK